MANEEHVKILKQGAEVWNKWRRENPSVRPDLIEANLSWANLIETNLRGADLSEAILSWAILRRADLSDANFSGTNLRGANLSRANLSRAMNLTQEQIDSAITDEDTKLPDYLK